MNVEFDVDLEGLDEGQTADLAGEGGAQLCTRYHEIKGAASGSYVVLLEFLRAFS